MAIRIVRLGSARAPDEGLRIGTVRRPPRGIPKAHYAAQNFFDVWLPNLAPSSETVEQAKSAESERDWSRFRRRYRREMAAPPVRTVLDVLAALSHHTNFSVGCYCADESKCHRSVLAELLRERGARMHP